MERALRMRRVGPYQLQAAIAAVHDEAPAAAETDWVQILGLYEVLARVAPSPVVSLNRAVALAQVAGPAAGLAAVDALEADPAMAEYRFYHATRGDLLRRLERWAEAVDAYARALELSANRPERRSSSGAATRSGAARCPVERVSVTGACGSRAVLSVSMHVKDAPMPATSHPGADAVRIVALRSGAVHETHDPAELPALLADEGTRVWIDLTDPPAAVVESIASLMGLHPLVAEDIIESNERAKIELVDDIIHIVMFALTRVDETEAHEIDFVLGPRFLLSVHTARWDPGSAHQLKLGLANILGRGLDFMLWALVDGIVDGYFPVFDQFADEIDDLQDEVVASAEPPTLHHLFRLKRELIRIRHVVGPSREIFSQLTSREFEFIADQQVFYFRDVYDHLIRLTDEFDTFRELVAGTAGGLPVDDQQQPLGDHEAAHRGDGHPRRDRGPRRAVRDERGGTGLHRRGGRGFWVVIVGLGRAGRGRDRLPARGSAGSERTPPAPRPPAGHAPVTPVAIRISDMRIRSAVQTQPIARSSGPLARWPISARRTRGASRTPG